MLPFFALGIAGEGSAFENCRADLIDGCKDVVDADPGRSRRESGAVRSDLFFPAIRWKKERFVVLGDLCAELSLIISLRALGVGLDGRGARLVFEVKAELRDEGNSVPLLLTYESSRLVTGRRGYGWLISARPSGSLMSSLLRLCRCPGSLSLCEPLPDLFD